MYSIGQFSLITQMTRKALRYYDEKGVLSPSYIDPKNGYRYYEPKLVSKAIRLLKYKSCQFPLEEIKELLKMEDLGNFAEIEHRIQIQLDRIHDAVSQLHKVESRLLHLQNVMEELTMSEITIKEIQDLTVAGIRRTGKYCIDIPLMIHHLFAYLGQNRIEPQGPPIFICHDEEYREEDADIEIIISVNEIKDTDPEVKHYNLPGGLFASTIHKGPYEEVGPSFANLFVWIEANGYKPVGPSREVYLSDPAEQKPEDYITEIMIPVEEVK